QEIAKQDAHFARFCGIRTGQGAEGVEAVEQEVWIDLRLQGSQFRLACQDTCLQSTGLRLARCVHRHQDVIEINRKEIEENAGSEKKRNLPREVLVHAGERSSLRQRIR